MLQSGECFLVVSLSLGLFLDVFTFLVFVFSFIYILVYIVQSGKEVFYIVFRGFEDEVFVQRSVEGGGEVVEDYEEVGYSQVEQDVVERRAQFFVLDRDVESEEVDGEIEYNQQEYVGGQYGELLRFGQVVLRVFEGVAYYVRFVGEGYVEVRVFRFVYGCGFCGCFVGVFDLRILLRFEFGYLGFRLDDFRF